MADLWVSPFQCLVDPKNPEPARQAYVENLDTAEIVLNVDPEKRQDQTERFWGKIANFRGVDIQEQYVEELCDMLDCNIFNLSDGRYSSIDDTRGKPNLKLDFLRIVSRVYQRKYGLNSSGFENIHMERSIEDCVDMPQTPNVDNDLITLDLNCTEYDKYFAVYILLNRPDATCSYERLKMEFGYIVFNKYNPKNFFITRLEEVGRDVKALNEWLKYLGKDASKYGLEPSFFEYAYFVSGNIKEGFKDKLTEGYLAGVDHTRIQMLPVIIQKWFRDSNWTRSPPPWILEQFLIGKRTIQNTRFNR